VATTDRREATGRPTCWGCILRRKGLCRGVEDQDSAALEAAHAAIRLYETGDSIYDQGDPSEYVFNLISGWVALHRDLADGRRQIIRFLLPGALFGVEALGRELGHGATAITNASVCPIGRAKLDALRHNIPSLNEQFIVMLERDQRRGIESITTLGQGNAKERVGGLLDELATTAGGETPIRAGDVVRMPLSQRHIAEATGLTSIHVNRVLRQMREERVVDLHDGALTVIDPGKLHALSHADVETAPGDPRPLPRHNYETTMEPRRFAERDVPATRTQALAAH
jgi:CRP/FNR family transcriptional regulator, anaerobic regulatory protein